MRDSFCRVLVAALGMTLAGQAQAQVQPPAQPTNPVPGIPSRDQIETPSEPQQQAPSTVRVEDKGAINAPPCALEDSPIRFVLNSVSFVTPEGGPIAPELQTLLAEVGQGESGDKPISIVCRLRDRANELLSRAGYVALAQIPAQEIKSGQIQIQIVTAHIVEVRIIGDLGPFRHVVEQRMAAIRELDPLNRKAAERILLRTGDIPGVDVRLALSAAGSKPGDVIGTLTVETRRAQVLANIQNFGSKQLGRFVASGRAEVYGLTGLADRTFVAYSNSTDIKEIHVLQVGHDFAITDRLRMGLRGSLAYSRPDILNLDLRSRSQIFGVDLNQQLYRTVDTQLNAIAGFEMLNQRTNIHQGGAKSPFTRDQIRVAFARVEGRATVLSSSNGFGPPLLTVSGYGEVRKGVSLFNASKIGPGPNGTSPSRFDGNPQATVLRGEIIADLRPFRILTLTGQVFGQWANDPLLNLEEFSLGNFTYGRGYDPGSNGGDRTLAFRLEPRLRVPIRLPVDIELTGFYDSVRIRNLDTGALENNRVLRSVGGGVRIMRSATFVLDALYAHPLDRALSTDLEKPSDRVLLSLTVQLFPWGGR